MRTPASGWDRAVEAWADELRRTGQVFASLTELPEGFDAEQWRAAMRRAARHRGLRIRTHVDQRGRPWAIHLDHEATPAEDAALRRQLDAAWARTEPMPNRDDLVREEQRKRMRLLDGTQAEGS